MPRTCKRAWVVLSLLFLVMACADQREPDKLGPSVEASPFEPDSSFVLLVGGRPLTEIRSAEQVADIVAKLEGEPRDGNLRQRISRLLESPAEGELQGLGGIPTRALLKLLLLSFSEEGRFIGLTESPQVIGQIQETVNGEPGFHFKPGEPMHVWVQMIHTAKSGDQVSSMAEMYRVEVPANQAAVERRAGTDWSVFPGFENVAFAVPADRAERTVDGKLIQMQYKLWADGTDVKVTDYWMDANYVPGTPPQWVKYTPTTAPSSLDGIFATDAESCFDMLFLYDPTIEKADGGALENGRLPPGSKPPYYCLGRCTDPYILNTN
jgi:hypothetical protein